MYDENCCVVNFSICINDFFIKLNNFFKKKEICIECNEKFIKNDLLNDQNKIENKLCDRFCYIKRYGSNVDIK